MRLMKIKPSISSSISLNMNLACRQLTHSWEASAKVTLYRDRFQLLFQRLSRDKHFAKPAFDFGSSYFGSCEVLTSWLSTKPGSPESLQQLVEMIKNSCFFILFPWEQQSPGPLASREEFNSVESVESDSAGFREFHEQDELYGNESGTVVIRSPKGSHPSMQRNKGQFASSKSNTDESVPAATNVGTNENWTPDNTGSQQQDVVCRHCGISEKCTPMMRRGLEGLRTLCNACGLMCVNKVNILAHRVFLVGQGVASIVPWRRHEGPSHSRTMALGRLLYCGLRK